MRCGFNLSLQSTTALFNPSSLSGIQSRYRADLGITIGTGVSAWSDISGSGDSNRNAVQANTTLQPTLNSSDSNFNNKPTITFSGSQLLQTGTWSSTITQPYTYVVICSMITGKYLIDSLSGGVQMALYDSAGILQIYSPTNKSSGFSALSPCVLIVQWNGVNTYFNGSQDTPQLIGSTGTNTAAGLTIGNYAAGGAFAGSTIAEIITYNRTLTTNEIKKINRYAYTIYGINSYYSTFTPASISGIQAWYKADKAITIGTGVSAWGDQSGIGDGYRNALQANTSLQPTYNSADGYFNYKPSITFSGSQGLQTGNWTSPITQPCTYVIVGKGGQNAKYFIDSLNGAVQMALYDSLGYLQLYSPSPRGTAYLDGYPGIMIVQWNSPSSTYFNGNQNTPVLIGNTGTNGAAGLTIGNYAGMTAAAGSTIAEILVYNRVLTSTEIININNYLSVKYNITITDTSPFTPALISGIQAWYRADKGITLGTGVSAWADQSGIGDGYRNAVQANTSLQPTFNYSDPNFNNLPSITFSGSQGLQTGNWTSPITQPCTYVIVGKGGQNAKYFIDSLNGAVQMALYDSLGYLQLYSPSNRGTAYLDGYPGVIIVQWNSPNTYYNPNQNTPVLIGNTGTNGAAGLTIGNYAGMTAAAGSTIAEVVVYNTTLTSQQIINLNSYYSNKYNIFIGN
jgi:hypothetical protein